MSRSESDIDGEFFDALVGNENESTSDIAPSPRNIPSPILSGYIIYYIIYIFLNQLNFNNICKLKY